MSKDINKKVKWIRSVVYIDYNSKRDEIGIVPVEALWVKLLSVDGQGI